MYIFLVSLLFTIPSMIADQGNYRKEEQVFKKLPDHVKCDICISKETAKDYIHILPYEFIERKDPNFYNPEDKVKITTVSAQHKKDAEIITLIIAEQIGIAGELLGGDKPLSNKANHYQIPFEEFAQWCKEHQESYQDKLEATQQGDN